MKAEVCSDVAGAGLPQSKGAPELDSALDLRSVTWTAAALLPGEDDQKLRDRPSAAPAGLQQSKRISDLSLQIFQSHRKKPILAFQKPRDFSRGLESAATALFFGGPTDMGGKDDVVHCEERLVHDWLFLEHI